MPDHAGIRRGNHAGSRPIGYDACGAHWPGVERMTEHRVFAMQFAKLYPLYVQKAERKGRTKAEVDEVIRWLTGYTRAGLQQQIRKQCDLKTFLVEAPAFNRNSRLITGVVCGVRVEDVKDPLMKKMRYLDKLVDELAKGKPMEKILRQ
jgi:hypothetical protein